ncbi:MAG: response regulator transcription factor [Myxococcaceae bacterium]|nr:response regulator transcription factor [Myxococcaceae bacterium]
MKVLVVEDDQKLARLLVRVLAEEGFTADTCSSGQVGLERLRAGGYDLAVLDRMLPDLDGVAVARALREAGQLVPVLMLTARGELKDRVEGLGAGADDYLVKPFEIEELVARLHALLRRAAGTGTGKLRFGALVIDRVGRSALLDGALLDLTPLELSLLVLLGENAGKPVARAEILSRVWSMAFDPGTNVVEVHVSRLRDKLGEHAGLIETVRGQGYRLRAPEGAP